MRSLLRLLASLLVVAPIINSDAQGQAASDTLLEITGAVPQPAKLTAAQIAQLPRRTVRIKEQSGSESEYEGVLLVDVLKQAGVKFGEDLRGPALANFLVVEAADKYRAVFALPELDPAFTDEVILLAERRDGKPLNANEGPLRIVIPAEKRHSRWVRQVVRLHIGKS
ncbi:MAG: molybdopterin-dependent oxidoreductase [Isosphaeraceae bacterium]|nr:molybdopterin-dependent oxidoreductase [Isosphaeraceae bacterium]